MAQAEAIRVPLHARPALLWLSIVFTAVVFAGVFVLLGSGVLPVKRISIQGEFIHLTDEQLAQSISDIPRRNLFLIDVRTIHSKLMELPWVKQVDITRKWPDALNITVVEHHALARWGETALLSDSGDLFYPEKNQIPEGLAWLETDDGSDDKTQQYILDPKTAANTLMQFQRELGSTELVMERVQVDRRGVWQLTLNNHIQLLLGREQLELRLRRFVDAWPSLVAMHAIEAVDLRYGNGLAVRWKEKNTGKKTNGTQAG